VRGMRSKTILNSRSKLTLKEKTILNSRYYSFRRCENANTCLCLICVSLLLKVMDILILSRFRHHVWCVLFHYTQWALHSDLVHILHV